MPEDGSGVKVVCDLISVGPGKKTWVLWKKMEVLSTNDPSLWPLNIRI